MSRKRIDYKSMVGKKYGKLTVLKVRQGTYTYSRGSIKTAFATCQCSCGNTIRTLAYSVFYGSTRSCGCLRSRPRMPRGGKSIVDLARAIKKERNLTYYDLEKMSNLSHGAWNYVMSGKSTPRKKTIEEMEKALSTLTAESPPPDNGLLSKTFSWIRSFML